MKTIETKTKVTWKSGDEVLTGSIVAGPFRRKPEEIEEYKNMGWDSSPYHNVYCNEHSNYHRVCTKALKVIEN